MTRYSARKVSQLRVTQGRVPTGQANFWREKNDCVYIRNYVWSGCGSRGGFASGRCAHATGDGIYGVGGAVCCDEAGHTRHFERGAEADERDREGLRRE